MVHSLQKAILCVSHLTLFSLTILPAAYPQTLPSPLTFDALQILIQSRSIRSIDHLLPLLPSEYRSRLNYVLMYQSRSRQAATEEAPRVISFGKDARFILTFTGRPGSPGYNNLEIMEWDEAAASYRFREIRFPASAGPQSAVEFDRTPTSCRECHSYPEHPIWEPYFYWPGAYGGHDSRMAPKSRELRSYARFREELAPTHPRYRHLEPYAFSSPRLLPIVESSTYLIATTDRGGSLPPGALNKLLSITNAKRLWQTIQHHSQFHEVQPLLDAWAGGCFSVPEGPGSRPLHHVPLEEFFPHPEASRRFYRYAIRQISRRNTQAALIRLARLRPFVDGDTIEASRYRREAPGAPLTGRRGSSRYPVGSFGPDSNVNYLNDLTSLAFILGVLRIDLSHFSLSSEVGSFAFADGLAQFETTMRLLIKSIPVPDIRQDVYSESYGFFQLLGPSLNRSQCRALALQSRHRLARSGILAGRLWGIQPEIHIPPLNSLEHLLRATEQIHLPPHSALSCITCHEGARTTSNPIIPFIPFSKEDSLRAALAAGDGRLRRSIEERLRSTAPHLRMPPSESLSTEDQREILRWIQSLH